MGAQRRRRKQARDSRTKRRPLRRARLPLIPVLCGWGNGGARGASQGLGPFSLGGEGPGDPPPASLPHRSPSRGLQVSGLGAPRSLQGIGVGRWVVREGPGFQKGVWSLPLGPAPQIRPPQDPLSLPWLAFFIPLVTGRPHIAFIFLLSKYLLSICPNLLPLSPAYMF